MAEVCQDPVLLSATRQTTELLLLQSLESQDVLWIFPSAVKSKKKKSSSLVVVVIHVKQCDGVIDVTCN